MYKIEILELNKFPKDIYEEETIIEKAPYNYKIIAQKDTEVVIQVSGDMEGFLESDIKCEEYKGEYGFRDISRGEYIDLKWIKDYLLKEVIVTTTTGKRFYGDAESRVDIQNAITIAEIKEINEITWKTLDGVELVSKEELIEALQLSLEYKGKVVGAI